jgi:hexulose-6-phosphate isomerase
MNDSNIGFMQGRLSPVFNGKIQEFPWNSWQQEFDIAKSIGFSLMEWTLDQDRLYENPLMTKTGQQEIAKLSDDYDIRILSLTGDCFMQSPFWKLFGSEKKARQDDFLSILDACSKVGITKIVIPLVDAGRIDTNEQSSALLDFLHHKEANISNRGIQIVFESDFKPNDLNNFIKQFDSKTFGINYDIGNSAALGFNVNEEFSAYGNRIQNVHIKDRELGGMTVPLGAGNADFNKVFDQLKKIRYKGNYILQTARASNGDHSDVLSYYKSMTESWVYNHGS